MDKITIACSQCSTRVKVPPTPGKRYKCPKCQGALVVPAAAPPASGTTKRAAASTAAPARPPGRFASRRHAAGPEKKGGKKGLVIGLVAAVVLLGGGGAYWFLTKPKPEPAPPPGATTPPDTGATPPVTATTPTTTTPPPLETTPAPLETTPAPLPVQPGPTPATAPKSAGFAFVPADAAALIVIRPAAGVRSTAFKTLLEQAGGAGPLEAAEQEIGLSPESIEEIVLSVKAAPPGGADPFLLLGTLKSSQAIDQEKLLAKAGERVEAEHGGKKYLNVKPDPSSLQGLPPGAPLPGELSVWFSDPKTAVFGHEILLKAAIDAGAAPAKLDEALAGVMADLPRDAQLVLAARVEPFQAMLPPPPDPSQAGGPSMPGLDKLKAAGLALVATDGLALSLSGDCGGDEKAANQLRGTMGMGLMGLGAMLASQKKQLAEAPPPEDESAKAEVERARRGLEAMEGILKSTKLESPAGRLSGSASIPGDRLALILQLASRAPGGGAPPPGDPTKP